MFIFRMYMNVRTIGRRNVEWKFYFLFFIFRKLFERHGFSAVEPKSLDVLHPQATELNLSIQEMHSFLLEHFLDYVDPFDSLPSKVRNVAHSPGGASQPLRVV